MKHRGYLEKECPHCGEKFTCPVSRPREFCSQSCKYAARVKVQEHPCPQCGTTVRETGRRKGKYCSRTCSSAAKVRPVECICRVCGKSFIRSPSLAGNFCSGECYNRHHEPPLAERFWRRVEKTETCWLWLGTTNHGGYGVIDAKIDGRRQTWQAHRFSYELAHGPIPNGMLVCHRCDTPWCVRPEHLFLGSQDDNLRDMRAKGREARGVKHGRAKLTPVEVVAIRDSVESQGKLARRFHVSLRAVQLIRNGTNWKRLD